MMTKTALSSYQLRQKVLISLQNRAFWTSKQPFAIHFFLAIAMFAPRRSQKSLYKFKNPINGNSLIRVMIISNWMMLIDRESLHTPGT